MITGKNNALVGPQNPKTLMPPPIAPPLGDLDTWKASEWTTHSHVNSELFSTKMKQAHSEHLIIMTNECYL